MTGSELLLLCHGAIASGKAKRQAQKLGVWMQARGVQPDICVAAPTELAHVSAEKALKAGGWSAQGIVAAPDISDPAPARRLDFLSCFKTRCLLSVADAGTQTDLLRLLDPAAAALRPGSLARVMPLRPAHRGAARQQIVCIAADELPARFPYPGPGAREMRDRPAYYYRQSAALPYQIRDGAIEIMLITSSSGRKWGIPKGICEPGLSPAQSAAREADEEAGVTGVMHMFSIGSFGQTKWGATCDVEVFPMMVTDIVADAERQEGHRRRRWVTPTAAADLVSNKGLGRIITAFAKR